MEQELFKAYVRAAMAEPGSPCPNADRLLALYQSPPDSAERAALQAHVATCAGCAESLQDIADFIDPPRPGELPAAPDSDKLFKNILATVASQPHRLTPIALVPPASTPSRKRFFSASSLLPIAASVAIAALASSSVWLLALYRHSTGESRVLEAQVRILQQEKAHAQEQSRAPVPNPGVLDVFPQGAVQRSGPSGSDEKVIPAGKTVTFLLHLPPGKQAASYTAKWTLNGTPVFQPEVLLNAGGACAVTLPRGFSQQGKYAVQLVSDSGTEVVTFNLTASQEAPVSTKAAQ
jgi:hypothetical protein